MKFPEYDTLDAIGLAEKIRASEVSAPEVLEAAIERIDTRNPILNAVVNQLYDRARQRLTQLPKDAPFYGVPFLLKDLKIQLEGTVTTNSTRLRTSTVSTQTSVLAQRYEDAGLVVVGKTNTPEFGIMGITEPQLRGPCRNPWNTNLTPGGSSGGSAAAVASRMVPCAHGGDGGGSIRIPASACGLFGLKPTRGRVTMAPFMGEAWGGFVQEHVLTRSVRDSAALLDAVDAPTPGEPYAAPHKARPWLDEVGDNPGQLKVAFTTETLYAGQTHPDCEAAVLSAAKLLEGLGHHVVAARPPFVREELVSAYFQTIASGISYFVQSTAKEAGKKPRAADFEPATWMLHQIGMATPAPTLLKAQIAINRAAREVAHFFSDHDLVLTPTLSGPPVPIGHFELSLSERVQLTALRTLPLNVLLNTALRALGTNALAATPNTQLFNQTGQPAMSVPLHTNDAGLPIGVQLAAGFGQEATLFRLAAQLEEAQPWADRLPPMLKQTHGA